MKITNPRNYPTKDQELPLMGRFMIDSLNRDILVFAGYSPEFTPEYVTTFELKIKTAEELASPKSEILKQKATTERINETLALLNDGSNRLSGYVILSNGDLKMTPNKFGITALKKSINKKDVESVIANLKFVNDNISESKEKLAAKGLSEELITLFSNAATSLTDDKRKQTEQISNRKGIILDHISLFNEIYAQLCNIMTVGKILFKTTNSAKLQDYTFSNLKKRVRRATTPTPAVTPLTPQI